MKKLESLATNFKDFVSMLLNNATHGRFEHTADGSFECIQDTYKITRLMRARP